MSAFADTFFNPEILRTAWPLVLSGLWVTLKLTALILPSGIVFGLALAVLRSRGIRLVNFLIVGLVDALRAIPPLVILILIFFALPYIEISMSGFAASWLGLSLVLAAFSEEIFWAALLSVPTGQWEAARATGLGTAQTLSFVIFPQAIRLAIPPLTNRAIAIGKATALASVIAVPEILNQASNVQAQTANPSPLTLAALAYLSLFAPLVVFSRWVETRFAWKR